MNNPKWSFRDPMSRSVWGPTDEVRPYAIYWNCSNYNGLAWPLEHDRDRSVDPIIMKMSELRALGWKCLEHGGDWSRYNME